jgi:hypothetical protein
MRKPTTCNNMMYCWSIDRFILIRHIGIWYYYCYWMHSVHQKHETSISQVSSRVYPFLRSPSFYEACVRFWWWKMFREHVLVSDWTRNWLAGVIWVNIVTWSMYGLVWVHLFIKTLFIDQQTLRFSQTVPIIRLTILTWFCFYTTVNQQMLAIVLIWRIWQVEKNRQI